VVPTFRKGRERWGSLACQGAVEVKVNINVKRVVAQFETCFLYAPRFAGFGV